MFDPVVINGDEEQVRSFDLPLSVCVVRGDAGVVLPSELLLDAAYGVFLLGLISSVSTDVVAPQIVITQIGIRGLYCWVDVLACGLDARRDTSKFCSS